MTHKKVTVTITRTKEYEIIFDTDQVNKEFFTAWEEHMDDTIFDEPLEVEDSIQDVIDEKDYPYLNLAKSIAHQHSEYDSERLDFISFSRTELPIMYTPRKSNFEYEFNWDTTDLDGSEK